MSTGSLSLGDIKQTCMFRTHALGPTGRGRVGTNIACFPWCYRSALILLLLPPSPPMSQQGCGQHARLAWVRGNGAHHNFAAKTFRGHRGGRRKGERALGGPASQATHVTFVSCQQQSLEKLVRRKYIAMVFFHFFSQEDIPFSLHQAVSIFLFTLSRN
jgi:hypothetical protein